MTAADASVRSPALVRLRARRGLAIYFGGLWHVPLVLGPPAAYVAIGQGRCAGARHLVDLAQPDEMALRLPE